MSPVVHRLYRTRLARWILYPFFVVGIPLGILGTLLPDSRWTFHLWGLACLTAMFWCLWRARILGVEVTDSGYVVHGTLTSKKIGWSEISSIYPQRSGLNRSIRIQVNNGECFRTSLLQGRVVTWEGGRTKDILSILRSELAAHSGVPTTA